MPDATDFFRDAWAVYRLVVEHDYLWHSHAGRGLESLLPTGRAVRFLDLACGDSDTTARVLAGRELTRYVGVDRSAAALREAGPNVSKLTGPAELVEADFVEFLESCPDTFDVIYIGLSAHHLGEAGLPRFFAGVAKCLAPGGVFAAYEPFTLPDETRADTVDRICAMALHFFAAMTPAQRQQVAEHVRGNDKPVSLATWDALATAAGLSPLTRVVRSPDRLYELVSHTQ